MRELGREPERGSVPTSSSFDRAFLELEVSLERIEDGSLENGPRILPGLVEPSRLRRARDHRGVFRRRHEDAIGDRSSDELDTRPRASEVGIDPTLDGMIVAETDEGTTAYVTADHGGLSIWPRMTGAVRGSSVSSR